MTTDVCHYLGTHALTRKLQRVRTTTHIDKHFVDSNISFYLREFTRLNKSMFMIIDYMIIIRILLNCNSFRPGGFQTQGNFPFGWIKLQRKDTVYWLCPAYQFSSIWSPATRHVNRNWSVGGSSCRPCTVLSAIQIFIHWRYSLKFLIIYQFFIIPRHMAIYLFI